MCIYVCADKIDSMDPKASSYPTLKLGSTSTTSTFGSNYGRGQSIHGTSTDSWHLWSCSRNASEILGINWAGTITRYYANRGTVVPIIEFI